MKINVILGLALAAAILFLQYYRVTAEQETAKARNYQQNNELLVKRIRGIYAEKIKLQQQNAELEQAAKEDKSYFDWNADIEHTAVIRQLRGQ